MSAPAHALAVHQTEALLFFTVLQLTLIVLAAGLCQTVFHSTPAAPMQMRSQIGLEFDFAHLSERNNRRAVALTVR